MKKSKQVRFISNLMIKNFSMSEELAKAIGTVVVQALTENAKDETVEDDFDLEGDVDLDDSEIEESSRDAGKVQEAEGPKNAPDLSEDFAELKKTVSNHSEVKKTEYAMMRDFFNFDSNGIRHSI